MKYKVNLSTIKVTAFFILLYTLVYAASNIVNDIDYDFWARLIAGKHVIQTGSVMYNDIFSYTPTHTWYDPEWLSSALIYLITDKFGPLSITITKVILICISLTFVIMAAGITNKKSLSLLNLEYFIITSTLFFAGGSSGVFLRCQLFSYILIPVWIILLEKLSQNYDTNKAKLYQALLPLTMLLWLNLHGACIAGAGIMILYILGRIINRLPVKKYMITLIPTFFVYFINPWGYKYIKFLIDSSMLDRSWIIEWLPLLGRNFKGHKQIVCLICILAILYIGSVLIKLCKSKSNIKTINYSKMLIIFTTLYLAFAHFKHVPLFAIVAGIYIYEDYVYIFSDIFNMINKKLKISTLAQKYLIYFKDSIAYTALFGFTLFCLIKAPPLSESHLYMKLLQFPEGAVEFINKNNIKGKMFLPYFYGSYMAYKTYPNIKIFMDGRQEQVYNYDLFDNEMFFLYDVYKKHNQDKPIVEIYPPDIYLLDINWVTYVQYVQNLPNYSMIYSDNMYALYMRNDLIKPKYKEISPKYRFFNSTLLENNLDFRK